METTPQTLIKISDTKMASSSSYNSPCAACKFLRRKCMPGCIFAPYFPPEEPQKFANVHKIFGASNVTKLLNDLLPHQREDAVNSLAYEAEARVRDPVYGCVGAISYLQRQVHKLQKELDAANADLIRFAYSNSNNNNNNNDNNNDRNQNSSSPASMQGIIIPPLPSPTTTTTDHFVTGFYQPSDDNVISHQLIHQPSYPFIPWNNDMVNVDQRGGGGGHLDQGNNNI
ncbi:Protein LATERAL ORGAN BOUNDARIES [Bienertia sinuspersici]